jgi:hypothetical protein
MFKQIKAGLAKIFSKKWMPLVVLLIIVVGLYAYSNNKYNVLDRMTTGTTTPESNTPSTTTKESVMSAPSGSSYALQPVANPEDLLPKDSNSQWATLNPISQGNVAIPDLLQSGYHIGLDTIGQTLKNPNYQLRSDPIIEKKVVSPWNQSTIEGDAGRIPLEIGQATR